MPTDQANRTLAIIIKAGKKGITPEDTRILSERVKSAVGDMGFAIQVQEVIGGDRIYVGTQPNKRDRIAAIQSMPEAMTAAQVAASLGLSSRQVCRYRALIKALSEE